MDILVKESQIKACFEELQLKKAAKIDQIRQIISSYHPIKYEELQPLRMISSTGSARKINQIQNLEQQFYEQKFVPSPDLMASYQQTFIKSIRNEQSSALVNNKLMNLFARPSELHNTPYAGKFNNVQQPVSIAYRSMTNEYNFIPPVAENKRVFIQQREEKILKQLNTTTKVGLQMSIPTIQQSLLDYEIKNLQSKNIVLQNYGKMDKWKSKREELQSKFLSKK